MPTAQRDRTFFKMCGSGNDFVFLDARGGPDPLETTAAIRTLCARGTGVGADGAVFLIRSDAATVGIRYYNSDGSRASLCGNATLCTTRLAVELGAADPAGFTIETDAGVIPARVRADGLPEIEFAPVRELADEAPVRVAGSERRIGFALAGVPHLVVEVPDVELIQVDARGRELRFDQALPEGANVNFVSPAPGGSWFMRTYERGVEGETLACGTGAVACASVLAAWGAADGATMIVTRSGRPLVVGPAAESRGPTLAGEGRIVFTGELRELT